MKCKLLALPALALALALCSGLASAAVNVALGGGVSLTGTGFGDFAGWCCGPPGSLAAPSTVTDGILLPVNAQWDIGTVFWTELPTDDTNTITVTLPTAAIVSHIDLQVDTNDQYGISYRDVGDVWHDLVVITPSLSPFGGMEMGSASFSAVTATAFAITAVDGDSFYSVSEFQAIGAPVPEAGTYALMMVGLVGVGVAVRRRASR